MPTTLLSSSHRRLVPALLTFTACFLGLSSHAFAHATGTSGGFNSGFAHPIGGWDHILAMVAVGLWAAQLGRPAIWLLPATFPLLMALGAVLGFTGFPVPGVEIGIALSAIILGLLVLAAFRPSTWIAVLVVASFAVFHGHAHGAELPAGQNGLLYGAGFILSTALLHLTGIVIAEASRWTVGRTLVRGAGALILIGGLYFLGGATGVL